jgi:hypothetical protein
MAWQIKYKKLSFLKGGFLLLQEAQEFQQKDLDKFKKIRYNKYLSYYRKSSFAMSRSTNKISYLLM